MASTILLEQTKAQAQAEAVRTVAGILGEVLPDRLVSAQVDLVAMSMTDYSLSVVAAELAKLVADQQERIADLEARLPAEEPEEEPEEEPVAEKPEEQKATAKK